MIKFFRPLIFVIVALVYFGLGTASLKLATLNDFASPIWSASGFAVGSIALAGFWLAPAIFLGSIFTNYTDIISLPSLLGISTGNTLEAVAGALLFTYILKRQIFKSYTEFTGVLLVACLASVLSATVGISILYLDGIVPVQEYLYAWFTWWTGDTVGIIIVLPLFSEFYLSKYTPGDFSLKRILGCLLLTFVTFAMTYLVFVESYNQAFVWILCPLFIFAGLFFGKKLSRLMLLAITGFIIILAAKGYGPFEFGSLNINLIYLQCLLVSYSFSVLFVRPLANGLKAGKIFILSTLFGWAIVFITIFIFTETEKKHLNADLKDSIAASVEDIKQEANKHELLLKATKSLLQIKPVLYFDEWKEYVSRLNLAKNYPSLVGLGYVRHVQKKDMPHFFEEAKKFGANDFQIKEFDKNYADKFSDRYIITYIEPLATNLPARGLDIGSDPSRRLAADKARHIKGTVSTGSITLLQNETGKVAFTMLHGVWTLENEFKGWILAPVIASDFFSLSFSPHAELLNLSISQNGVELFSKKASTTNFENKEFLKKIDLPILGLIHQLEFYPTSSFFKRHSHSAPPLALLLSLFMLFIAGFLLEQMTFSQRAEILIQQRTDQLEESNIKLIHSSKMASLGEMASAMAHEINNPITIILGKIKVLHFMLADLNVNNPSLNEEINKIEHTTERISKIVKGLKSFSRVADDDPFELVPLEVVLNETLDLCAERLKVSGIKLIIDKVPQVCIFCRPAQISQVFLNILNNASDAVANVSNKMIHITFKIREPDQLFIIISDTGDGIPAKIIPRIMEPFFTTKVVGKGTGLGLSIAKGIIEDHGGTISLDNDRSQTSFIIELPLKTV